MGALTRLRAITATWPTKNPYFSEPPIQVGLFENWNCNREITIAAGEILPSFYLLSSLQGCSCWPHRRLMAKDIFYNEKLYDVLGLNGRFWTWAGGGAPFHPSRFWDITYFNRINTHSVTKPLRLVPNHLCHHSLFRYWWWLPVSAGLLRLLRLLRRAMLVNPKDSTWEGIARDGYPFEPPWGITISLSAKEILIGPLPNNKSSEQTFVK